MLVEAEVNITSPENGSFAAGSTSITGIAYDPYLDKLSLKIDGVEVSDELPYLWNTYESSGRAHLIELTVVDTSNNSASVNITVFTDNTPPAVDIKAPLEGDYSYTENVTIDFSVTDDFSGLKSFNAILDGADISDGMVLDLSNFALSEHTFTLEAEDYAGNYNSTSVTFAVVDDIRPSVSIFEPMAREYEATEESTVNFTAWDEKSEVVSLTAELDGETRLENGETIDMSSLSPGYHSLVVTAVDAHGNTEEESVTFPVALPMTIRALGSPYVPIVNQTKLFSNLEMLSVDSYVQPISVEKVGYESKAEVSLDNPELENVTVVKPLRLETIVSEYIEATFNGQGSIIEASATGKLILLNKEAYPGKYGFNITLGNTSHTNLSETYYVGNLSPGENLIADYHVLKGSPINLTFDWNTSFNRSLRYGLEETIEYRIIISNPSLDDLRNVSVLIPLPENLSRLDVLGVEPSDGLLYDAENEQLNWSGDLGSLEEVALSFRADVKATDTVFFTDRVLRDVFEVSVEYEVNESLSGLTVEDVAGNEFYVADLEESTYATSSRVNLTENLDITILSKTVLAWTTDEPNAEFIEKLAERKPDVSFDSAHTKAEFFSKLRNGFYSVIFLANTDSANELTDAEINEIKGSLSSYDSIGKGLIVSGFGLKYAPELGGVLGDKYIGSLPMGEKFEIRPVVITEAHPITQGYEDTELSAVGWAVRAVPESSTPLARFEDIMPGNALGKPSHLKELPAVTVSAYGSGSGVLFAPDIGTSAAEGFNGDEWLEMASRAIDWISASSGVGANIGIEKDANPKSITVKTAPSDKSNDYKHAKVRVTVKNTGSLDLFNVYVAETLPAGLTLINGTLNKSVGTLNVGDSYTFNYSFWVPADYPTTYELVTTVTSTDSRGREHSFEQSLYLDVEFPPGVNASKYRDNGSSIRLVKRIVKQGGKTKVTIDLQNRDKLPVKGVWIEEAIPEEVYKETHTGAFSKNGLFWDIETIEKKVSVEYFLRFPEVDEPTTYELKTVVEYQTLEDFKTLEEINHITINPEGDANLTEGKRASKVKEKGKGYSKVHLGSKSTKGGEKSKGKKKGHDKDKGKDKDKPDKPGKPEKPPENPGNGNGGGNGGGNGNNGNGNGGGNLQNAASIMQSPVDLFMSVIVVLIFSTFMVIDSKTRGFTVQTSQIFRKAKMASMIFLIGTSPIALAALSPVSAQEAEEQKVGSVELKATEELTAVYGANGSLISSSLAGKITVVNIGDDALGDVAITFGNISLTDLPETLRIPSLPPGENIAATYGIDSEPRLGIRESWRSVTYDDYLIEQGVEGDFNAGTQAIVYGVDNVLEFNITLENRWEEGIQNVTVSDLLPDTLEFISMASEEATYDPAADALLISELPPQSNFTVALSASLKKEVVGDSGADYLGLSKETTAKYTILVEKTASWVPFAEVMDEVEVSFSDNMEVLDDIAYDVNYSSGVALDFSFDFASAFEEGDIEGALEASQEFTVKAESISENFAKQAGTVQKMIDDWENLTATVKEATTISAGSLDEVLDYTQENGLPEEVLEGMQQYGVTQEEVIDMIETLNSGSGVELPDLIPTLQEYKSITLEMEEVFIDSAITSLEDQIGINIYELGQQSRPATQEEYQTLSQIKFQLVDAVEQRDWQAIQTRAGEEADYAKGLATATNNFTFVGFYSTALKTEMIATLALNGDEATAEEMLVPLIPLIEDDPGPIYFEGDDWSDYYGWYEVLPDDTIVLRIVAPCCGFDKSVTIEGKKYDVFLNYYNVPYNCGGSWFNYGARVITIEEDGEEIYYNGRWRDASCKGQTEEVNVDDRTTVDQIYMDYRTVFKVWFKSHTAPPPPEPEGGTISGKVHDARRRAIADAPIDIVDKETGEIIKTVTTGPTGEYEVEVSSGSYWLYTHGHPWYSEDGYVGYLESPKKSVDVSAGEATTKDVLQVRQPARFSPEWHEEKADTFEEFGDRLSKTSTNIKKSAKIVRTIGRYIMYYGIITAKPLLIPFGAGMYYCATSVYLGGIISDGVAEASRKTAQVLDGIAWVQRKLGG